MPKVVPPTPSRDDQFFWDGVEQGRLLARKCAECGHLQHPPSPMCPRCGSVAWVTSELSGRGIVNSWIVSRHPTEEDDQPRIVALIDLEEGVRFVSNIQEIATRDVRNDMPVEVLFTEIDGVRLAQFRPSDSEA